MNAPKPTTGPKVLKTQMLPGGCVAIAIVRNGPHEFYVREAGWAQSMHRSYTDALAAFNARIPKATGAAQ